MRWHVADTFWELHGFDRFVGSGEGPNLSTHCFLTARRHNSPIHLTGSASLIPHMVVNSSVWASTTLSSESVMKTNFVSHKTDWNCFSVFLVFQISSPKFGFVSSSFCVSFSVSHTGTLWNGLAHWQKQNNKIGSQCYPTDGTVNLEDSFFLSCPKLRQHSSGYCVIVHCSNVAHKSDLWFSLIIKLLIVNFLLSCCSSSQQRIKHATY